jgi:hypothetical protein
MAKLTSCTTGTALLLLSLLLLALLLLASFPN